MKCICGFVCGRKCWGPETCLECIVQLCSVWLLVRASKDCLFTRSSRIFDMEVIHTIVFTRIVPCQLGFQLRAVIQFVKLIV